MQNEFKGLRHYIDIVESAHVQTDEDAASAGQAVGNALGTAAGVAALPARGAAAAGQWLAGKAGQAWDAAKQGVQNFAQGATQGAQQGWQQTSPQAIAQAVTGGAAKTPTTPEEIKAFQQANGLKPDGIMGPKTLAAMKAKGMTPPAAGQGAKPAAAPAKPAAASGPKGPAVPNNQMVNPDSQQGQMLAAQTAGMDEPVSGQGAQASNATADTTSGPANMGAAAPAGGAGNPWAGKDPAKEAAWAKLTPNQQKWLGGADPTDSAILARAPKNESVSYQNDELNRIMSIVQYR